MLVLPVRITMSDALPNLGLSPTFSDAVAACCRAANAPPAAVTDAGAASPTLRSRKIESAAGCCVYSGDERHPVMTASAVTTMTIRMTGSKGDGPWRDAAG